MPITTESAALPPHTPSSREMAPNAIYVSFAEVVASFRITGIDTSEALDPADPMAFVTGLQFVGAPADDFTVKMIPITVAVPEPATMLLMLAGTALLATRLPQRVRAGTAT